jgi:cation diffusion facilitator CzcD-associated flavoprotein CzcO
MGAPDRLNTIVIGAGPGGLATAAMLVRRNVETVIIEQAGAVGGSWRARYDNLHLNTVRWLSHLPGLPIARKYGRWPSRDAFVDYLGEYRDHFRLPVQFGTRVDQVERGDGHWLLRTSAGELSAPYVVIATGHQRVPYLPNWPGRQTFTGDFIHSAFYRNPAPYAGRDVLVVGSGDSGSGIALDLVKNAVGRVRVAVRSGPNIVVGERFGIPAQLLGIISEPLPGRLIDILGLINQRISVGNLSKYGLPSPKLGPYTRSVRDYVGPIVDFGFVRAVKRRQIEVVPAVERFEGAEVLLAGGGRVKPDAVIAATGFRPCLEPLVGHLGVLSAVGRPLVHGSQTHANAPGLYFVGYKAEISGNIRQMSIQARKISRTIAAALARKEVVR